MTEYAAVVGIGKGIHAFGVFLREQVKEAAHFGMVQKRATVGGAKKLPEIKSYVLVDKIVHESAKVVGIDVHPGQTGVGVRVAKVVFVPFLFGALLHGVVPGKHFLLDNVVHEVEGSAGELQNLGRLFGEFANNSLAQFGLGAFVGFVDDD